MNSNLLWILFLMLQCIFVISQPVGNPQGASDDAEQEMFSGKSEIKSYNASDIHNEKVISVRITSSVAIGRSQKRQPKTSDNNYNFQLKVPPLDNTSMETLPNATQTPDLNELNDMKIITTELPPQLVGANIEYIKQLDAKKKTKQTNLDQVHPCELLNTHQDDNEYEEILEESPSTIHVNGDLESSDDIKEIPLGRKVASSSGINHFNNDKQPDDAIVIDDYQSPGSEKNNINSRAHAFVDRAFLNDTININEDVKNNNQSLLLLDDKYKLLNTESALQIVDHNERETNHTDDSQADSSFKTVIEVATQKLDKSLDEINPIGLPEVPSQQNFYQDYSNKQINGGRSRARLTTVSFNIVHDAPQMATINTHTVPFTYTSQGDQEKQPQSPKIYSEPAKIYSEPAKYYSEPAKIYSEPSKIYSEPAKVYSEPSKVYSVPSKFYSEPASLHLDPSVSPTLAVWQQTHQTKFVNAPSTTTTHATTILDTFITKKSQKNKELQPEKNYEVDENDSVLTNGRSHGIQETTTEKCKEDNCKVGYVVEGRQFKKYRVEERTSDGFLVGEYGVVRNEDGALRGVRYTADSDASPRLIYDALMKFLQLR